MGRMDIDEKVYLPVVDRSWWGDRSPRADDMVNAVHPFTWVRFTYDDLDGWDPEFIDIIGAMMRWEKQMMMKMPDVPYNFLIGNGGIVYEGRGWLKDADRPDELANMTGKCLDIAYIGDFSQKPPPWENIYTAHNLILHGLKQKYVSWEYKVIPYNVYKMKFDPKSPD